MHRLGIRTGADLRNCTEAFLNRHFGRAGTHFHKIARGIDERPVMPDRPRKSAGSETTFPRDLTSEEEILGALQGLIDDVWNWRERSGISGRTATVKIKYADFELITRSRTYARPISSRIELAEAGRELAASVLPLRKPVRLLGVAMSNFDIPVLDNVYQMTFAF
jgi:DNA polymerase-4